MMKRTGLILIGTVMMFITSCKHNNDEVQADEAAKMKDPNPLVYLASDKYVVTAYQDANGAFGGSPYDLTPNDALKKFTYRLKVASKGSDSLSITIDGSGLPGLSFQNYLLGVYGITNSSTGTLSDVIYLKQNAQEITGISFKRDKYSDKTTIQISFGIWQGTDPSSPLYNQYYIYDLIRQRFGKQVAGLTFTRLSSVVI